MSDFLTFFKGFDKTKLINPLNIAYFLLAFIEVIAESNNDVALISFTKPFLMPILVGIYCCSSKKYNFIFIFSVLSSWIANVLFISLTVDTFFIGTLFFLVNRILVFYIVAKISKFPGYLPLIIGCLPFFVAYLVVGNLICNELESQFALFVISGVTLILFGGFCLGTYILKSTKQNNYLLVSTIFITVTQFIFVLKIYYATYHFLRPLGMALFVIAQYLLYHFILMDERRKRRYKLDKSMKKEIL